MKKIKEEKPKIIGWFEEYGCGCCSNTVKTKKDLLDYCYKHGYSVRHIHPIYKEKTENGS